MKSNTHLNISSDLVGNVVEIGPGTSMATLSTRSEMTADDRGLIHGGFTFGLADYAAMLAVNDPNVVLGAANCKFLAPVRGGEELLARAEVVEEKGKKRLVRVTVFSGSKPVMEGDFTCFVLDRHVFEA